MGETVSVRLPDDIAKRLDELVKSLDKPKTYMITKALREYPEEYEDYLIALRRINDNNDEAVILNEIVKRPAPKNWSAEEVIKHWRRRTS